MKRHITQIVFLSFLFAPSAWSEGMVYKCINEEGAYIYQNSACGGNANTVGSWALKKSPTGSPVNEKEKDVNKVLPVVLSLKQNPSGHYFTEGSINDKSLKFVIDTGASYVSLPESLAHDALIYCDDKVRINTANGIVDSCIAKIKTLKFGPFTIQDVIAVIQPNLGQPLLGMNVLQLFRIEQNSGEMQISNLEKAKTETN